MKKYFITGLIILLPLTLTLVVVGFIFNLLTKPFVGILRSILERYTNFHYGLFFIGPEQVETLLSQALILIFLIAFTTLLGFLGRWFFIHYMIKIWEFIIHRIPFVSSIYKACQDVIKTVFASKTNAFKQVVMVPFPNPDTLTIGLLTRENLPNLESSLGSDLVVVFIPTTPNPTSGFLSIFKRSDIVPLDMKIEDAFKYVISCGVIMTPFRKDMEYTVSNKAV